MKGIRAGTRAVRPAAVAGMFYHAGRQALRAHIDSMLQQAGQREPTAMTGVIVPHAGHIYSGPVAASAYRLLPRTVDRVLLIGPSHFVPLRSLAASGARAWQTPLGDVPLDTAEVQRLADTFPDIVSIDDVAHSREHCLEVQIPFLQRVLDPGWELVPMVIGHASAPAVSGVIDNALSSPRAITLLVVSTDLSHYLPYDLAAAMDRRTADAVVARDAAAIDDDGACGAYALRGALEYAAGRGLAVHQLDLRSSGDTAGPRDRVVGYGAFLIDPPPVVVPAQAGARHAATPEDERHGRLLALARRTIEEALRTGRQSIPSPPALDADLREPGAAFVTLRSRSTGELLGCVGSMEAYRPLGVDVAAHALDAAFHDTRFYPLTAEQASDTRIDISVLGPLVAFPVDGYDDLVARVPVGKGLFMSAGGYRATYLPSVWKELHAPALFVASLWRKAGLDPGTWPRGTRIYTYDVSEFGDA